MRETLSPNSRAPRRLAALALLLLSAAPALRAQAPADPRLGRAVAALRNVDPEKLTDAQKEAKTDEFIEAFDTITKAGPAGAAALKAELRRLDEAGQRDDRFRLAAGALFWAISKLDEAEAIAAVWQTTPLKSQYNYVFYTAFDAAVTRDERALPMLRAVLRDREGTVFFGSHALRVLWPLTHEFIWGAFGAKGAPALARVLETSTDPVESASAALLLAGAQHLPALPRIRQLAAAGRGEPRQAAVRALGFFGHPQDFDFLVAGLRSPDPALAFHHAYALYEYEDLRAVPALVAQLGAADETLQDEVVSALTHLLTPAALEALRRHSQTSKHARARAASGDFVRSFLEETRLTWDAYAALPAGEREATVRRWRDHRDGLRLAAGGEGRPLTRATFLRMAEGWQSTGRLERPNRRKIEVGEILSAATPDDINLLLDVRGALYRRLSDECIYEVRRVDAALRHLGRSRYRRETRTTEKVEAR